MHWRLHYLEIAMSPTRPSRPDPDATVDCCLQLAEHAPAYRKYLLDRGNVNSYVRSCEAAVAHLSMWMVQANKSFSDIGEELVAEFAEEHLPRCKCATTARRREDVRAALRHLLIVLRDAGAIAAQAQDTTPVGEELRHFDRHMTQVQGLAGRTRENAVRLVGRLLRRQFADGAIEFDAITPEHVRGFFASRPSSTSRRRAFAPWSLACACTSDGVRCWGIASMHWPARYRLPRTGSSRRFPGRWRRPK